MSWTNGDTGGERGHDGPHVRVGERWEGYPPTGLIATVRRTGRAPGSMTTSTSWAASLIWAGATGRRFAMSVHVNGRLWGLIAVGSGQGPCAFPVALQRKETCLWR
jgi:hypothetical protein